MAEQTNQEADEEQPDPGMTYTLLAISIALIVYAAAYVARNGDPLPGGPTNMVNP